MPTTRRWQISTPGRIPGIAIGFDIPEGDAIDPSTIEITSEVDEMYGTNAEVNTVEEEIEDETFPVGSVIAFDLVAEAGIEEGEREVYVDFNTLATQEQRIRWKKVIEVYEHVPVD